MLRTGYAFLISLFLLIGTQVHGEEPAVPDPGAPTGTKTEDVQVTVPGTETTPLPAETPAAPDAPAETPAAPPPAEENAPSSPSSHLLYLRVVECASIRDDRAGGKDPGSSVNSLELSPTLTEKYPDSRPAKKAQGRIEVLAKR
jgi:hypothetical protein